MAVDIGRKLEQIIEWTGLSVNQFAVQFGEKPDKYYNVIKGKNNPSWDMLTQILEAYPRIDGNWLLKDEGSMLGTGEVGIKKQVPKEQVIQAEIFSAVKPDSREKQTSNSEIEVVLLNRIIDEKERVISLLEKQVHLLEKIHNI